MPIQRGQRGTQGVVDDHLLLQKHILQILLLADIEMPSDVLPGRLAAQRARQFVDGVVNIVRFLA